MEQPFILGASREAAEGTENGISPDVQRGPPPQTGVLCQWAPLPEETNSKQSLKKDIVSYTVSINYRAGWLYHQ